MLLNAPHFHAQARLTKNTKKLINAGSLQMRVISASPFKVHSVDNSIFEHCLSSFSMNVWNHGRQQWRARGGECPLLYFENDGIVCSFPVDYLKIFVRAFGTRIKYTSIWPEMTKNRKIFSFCHRRAKNR